MPSVHLKIVNHHPTIKYIRKNNLLQRLYRLQGLRANALCFVDIHLITDDDIQKLSNDFLGEDHSTDIITFSYLDDGLSYPSQQPIGEIYISLDTATSQAEIRHATLYDEVLLLIIHGLLHIDGQDDECVSTWKEMKHRELLLLTHVLG